MADDLPDVRLNSPVMRVEQDGAGVTLYTSDGPHRAPHAILAVPPTLLAGVLFDPPLPPRRVQLQQRLPMGAVIKCLAVYERPFWRDAGLSGMAISDRGPVTVTFDNSPPQGRPGVLLGFIEGNDARALMDRSEEERRGAALTSLARLFGEAALSPLETVECNWAAGALQRRLLRRPVRPRHLDRLRRDPARPGGPLALGRSGNGPRMDELYGRCRRERRARSGRGVEGAGERGASGESLKAAPPCGIAPFFFHTLQPLQSVATFATSGAFVTAGVCAIGCLTSDILPCLSRKQHRDSFQVFLDLLLNGTDLPFPERATVKSSSAPSRFLNHTSWDLRTLCRFMRQAALQLFNDTWKVALIRLEKADKFSGLSDWVHGVHLIVLYSCCGDLPLSRSDLAWQRHVFTRHAGPQTAPHHSARHAAGEATLAD